MVNPACSICGKPAISAARDVKEIPPKNEWREFEPYGDWRYGCAEHPVLSRTLTLENQIEERNLNVGRITSVCPECFGPNGYHSIVCSMRPIAEKRIPGLDV